MAYVAVTKEIVRDIERNIDALRSTEVSTLRSVTIEETGKDPAFLAVVYKILWKDVYDLAPRLQKYNVKRRLYIELNIASHEEGATKTLTRAGDWSVPCIYNKADPYTNIQITHKQIVDAGGDSVPIFKEWVTYENELSETNSRWNKLAKQVTSFVEAAKSVNEAVKLWPDLRRYLPAAALERLDKKTERGAVVSSGAAEMLAKLDTETLNTSTVVARLAGAKV
jgi:hypothetical protein